MLRTLWITATTALCLGLAACGGTMPASSSSGSGITVFGDIDSSVTHTR